jgi:uridine kinase
MTAAILISGYLRSYENIINFIKNEINPYFTQCDTFIHITKNESKEDKYFNLIDEENDVKKIITSLNPKSILIEPNENYSDNKNINSTINQWSKLHRLNEIKKSYETVKNKKYDLVIRLRPDLNISKHNLFSVKYLKNKIYLPFDSKIDKTKLSNLNDDHLCDAFAFGESELMDKYFSIYENITHNITKYGFVSETLLYHHLKYLNIEYEKLDIDYGFVLSKCNIFAICGDSGSGKSTLSKLLKNFFNDSFTLECDRYHKWERGDNNWSSFTHLNPNANYIEKMKEDVFSLKIGKEIYQVDYDHSTGKFTEKQQIDPSNNLIVCGLHTIYDKNINSVYDVKIFMDPQKELKYKWKIVRDVKERGYDIKKVLESIKKRELDYENFILPQKENADIVVNFFSKNEIDINNIEQEDDLGLRLIIKSNFNIEKIKNQLDLIPIKYEFHNDGNSCTFTFNTYVPLSNLRYSKNNFYDYIFLFIFNL